MRSSSLHLHWHRSLRVAVAATILSASVIFAADEACTTCGGRVAVSGDFAHRKDPPFPRIEGAGSKVEAYTEDVNGPQFTVTIANLPAGKYDIEISGVETVAHAAGERVFSVSANDTVLANDYDLFAAAGGAKRS